MSIAPPINSFRGSPHLFIKSVISLNTVVTTSKNPFINGSKKPKIISQALIIVVFIVSLFSDIKLAIRIKGVEIISNIVDNKEAIVFLIAVQVSDISSRIPLSSMLCFMCVHVSETISFIESNALEIEVVISFQVVLMFSLNSELVSYK